MIEVLSTYSMVDFLFLINWTATKYLNDIDLKEKEHKL